MTKPGHHPAINEFFAYLSDKFFPCVAARAAVARQQIKCMVADHMACPHDDKVILQFLYDFVDNYRASKEFFHSAAIIFMGPLTMDEKLFDQFLWQRLQSLARLDSATYAHDKRVDADPGSPSFSFSLKEEAFFIVGLHPGSSRAPRRFKYPVMVFNPHEQFELLKQRGQYAKMKTIVRQRDLLYSGSVNPMLHDFGEISETFQYSGRHYDSNWQCPLKMNDGKDTDNSTP